MAHIDKRTLADGVIRYDVRYRNEKEQKTKTFLNLEDAKRFCEILNQLRNDNLKIENDIEYPLNIINDLGFNFMKCDSVYLYENFDKNYEILKTQKIKNILHDGVYYILDKRYKEHKTFESIAYEVNLTRERVRQIIHRALIVLGRFKDLFFIGYENLELQKSNEELREEIILKQRKLKKQLDSNELIDEYKDKINEIPVEELGLPNRISNCLLRANIHYLNQLENVRTSDLLKIRNLGRSSAKIVEAILDEYKIPHFRDFHL